MINRMIVLVTLAISCQMVVAADDGWKNLFDGKTFAGWTTEKGKPVKKGWVVEDGCIHRNGKGGSIVTVDDYEDFEMEIEWKISEKGNSGIKYRYKNKVGPEYQVLDDDKHSNGKNPLTRAAAMYAMFPTNDQKVLKPVGEFNKARIVVKGTKFQHWLNGKKVLEVDTSSEEWAKAKAKSKYKSKKGYGLGPGKILLQDHNDKVWYRNIRIKKTK